MLIPRHEIVDARDEGATPRRAISLGTVGLLHLVAVYALITGMTPQIVKLLPRDIQVAFVHVAVPIQPVSIPTVPTLKGPKDPTTLDPKMPTYTIADPNNTSLRDAPGSHVGSPSDSGAVGVSSTHSTPPYPDQARLMAHQGIVLLRLTISPNGDVVAADIVRTSGFAELDAQAASWVVAHWKYKPAIVSGVAVTSQTQAAVKFDLKLTRG